MRTSTWALVALLSLTTAGCGSDDGGDKGGDKGTADAGATDAGGGGGDAGGAADAGPSIKCGEGTELKDGECVAKAPGDEACGEGTKLVDGKCVVDEDKLRPMVASVTLDALSATVPSKAGLLTLHSTAVFAKLTIDAEPFESEVVIGVRNKDGSKQCALGILPIDYAGNIAGKPQGLELKARLLVQAECAKLVGTKDLTLYASFDPFLETQLAGRKEITGDDTLAYLAASLLKTDTCEAFQYGEGSVSGGHVHTTTVACGDTVAVLANPGRDLAIHGSISYGDADLDADQELDTPASSGGVVLEVEAFNAERMAAALAEPSLPKGVTEIAVADVLPKDKPEFSDFHGTGNQAPAAFAVASYIIYGLKKDEEVDGDEVSLGFAIRPKGVYADDDKGWMTVPTKLSIEAKAGEEPTIEELKAQFLESLQGINLKSVRVPLFFSADLRQLLTLGAWKDHSFFELRGCLEADFDEKGGDAVAENNCQVRTAVVVRKEVVPSQGVLRADPNLLGADATADLNAGGGDKLKPMEAALPSANTYFGLYKNMGKNIGFLVAEIGAWGFVNLRTSTGEVRLGEMRTSRTLKPGTGVYGHAFAAGWGTLIDPIRWGNDPVAGGELMVMRPWDQPITKGTFGTFDKFDIVMATYLFGYEVFDFKLSIPLPNIGTPMSVQLLEVTFLKVLSATVETPGDNKNGLKFYLTAGLTKTPGDKAAGKKGKVNNKQKGDVDRPDSVEGVEIEFSTGVGVEASMTMERKGQTGKIPPRATGKLPSECSKGNNRSWLSDDGTRCYYVPAIWSNRWGAESRCAQTGGKLYTPKQHGTNLIDYRWNIRLDKTLADILKQLGKKEPTPDELIKYAFGQEDPLAWILNLDGALAVRNVHKNGSMWWVPGVSYGSGGGQCPWSCKSNPNTKQCRWNKSCSVPALYFDSARKAADKVVASLSKHWNHVSQWYWVGGPTGNVKKNNSWGFPTYADANTGPKQMAANWAAHPTWFDVQRPGWMDLNNHSSWGTPALELRAKDTWVVYTVGDQNYYKFFTGHHQGRWASRDLKQYVNNAWNNFLSNDFKYRAAGLGYHHFNIDYSLVDDMIKRRGTKGRVVGSEPGHNRPVLCYASIGKIGGKDAESYSIIMTPGSEASAAVSVAFGTFFTGFGADLSLVGYEFSAPIEFRGMRAKDNSMAELAIWQKASLDVLKVKFEVWVRPWFSVIKHTLVDMANGVYHKEWDLWGPVVSSFGCGGGSCGYKPAD